MLTIKEDLKRVDVRETTLKRVLCGFRCAEKIGTDSISQAESSKSIPHSLPMKPTWESRWWKLQRLPTSSNSFFQRHSSLNLADAKTSLGWKRATGPCHGQRLVGELWHDRFYFHAILGQNLFATCLLAVPPSHNTPRPQAALLEALHREPAGWLGDQRLRRHSH
jgi:hypothetical protein